MSTRALTWSDFLNAGKPEQRWEYIEGEVVFMSPTGFDHGKAILDICEQLGQWQTLAQKWVSVGADVAFRMSGGEWLCPDAAVVRRERLPSSGSLPGPATFPPDVAFEVISPNDTKLDIARKRSLYERDGVVQVWVNLAKRTIEVVSPTYGVEKFGDDRNAVVRDLPGFALRLFL